MSEGAPTIPIPPLELRQWVGPRAESDYDNPNGTPVLESFGIAHQAYRAVFDFGCGCGRQARQLLQQTPRPSRYVGIDVRGELIEWCRDHLAPIDPAFRFLHHDVYAPAYAPGNSLRLALPFPVESGAFPLVLANSVFTHLSRGQTEYYLTEVARILTPDGVAFTSWLFFDRASFSFLPGVYSLYASEIDFGLAVLFDREWFLATVRRLGLGVRRTIRPQIAGYQWVVLLVKRTPGMADDFPLGADGAEWVSGASLKPMAATTMTPEMFEKYRQDDAVRLAEGAPPPPPLEGALASLAGTRAALERSEAELRAIKATYAWAIGRGITSPVRWLKGRFGK
jgi:SAM-dependent methyltransferase